MPATTPVLQDPTVSPFPTQTGIVPGCSSWAQAFAKDDTCSWLADRANIQPEYLYQYNPFLGTNGENCAEKLLPDYWYCVAMSSAPGASDIEELAVIPSTATATATTTVRHLSDSSNEPDVPNAQDILAARTPASAATDIISPRMPATSTITRVSTITIQERDHVGDEHVSDAGKGTWELPRAEEEEDDDGKREERTVETEAPQTVTKIVRLVRRNRWMERHQDG